MCAEESKNGGHCDHEKKMMDGSIEFAFGICFKFTLKEAEDFETIIQKAVHTAYRDAIMQGAFSTKLTRRQDGGQNLSREEEEAQNKKNADAAIDVRKKAEKKLCEEGYILNLLQATSEDEYNESHRNACVALRNLYRDNNLGVKLNERRGYTFFTYGNAQKWINITMKLLYAACGYLKRIGRKNERLFEYVEKSARFYHAPIDGFILEAVNKAEKRRDGRRILNDEKYLYIEPPTSSDEKEIRYKKIRWSQIEDYENEYMKAQGQVRNLLDPGEWAIEWETRVWNEERELNWNGDDSEDMSEDE